MFRHKKLIIKSQTNSPSVSVVIAARNEELNLHYIIQDLVAQEYPLDKLEVIFVDDRSTDSTNQILKKTCDDYGFIKYVQIKNLNEDMTPKKNALSKGIEIAAGEIIISTDADCRVGKFWVSSMAYSVKNKDCITIGYSEIDENQKSIFELYQKLDFFGKKKFLLESKNNTKKTVFNKIDLNDYSDKIFIEGHFESEKYFIDYKKEIIQLFKIKKEKVNINNRYKKDIDNSNSVSICIRQNRYSEGKHKDHDKSNKFTKDTIDYIYKSIEHIKKNVEKPKFFIWSNDLSNLSGYFNQDECIFIDNKQIC